MEKKEGILRLRLLLLDMLSPIRRVQQSDLDALSSEDWILLLQMLKQHRLKPLLHWQLVNHRQDLRLPDTVVRDLAHESQRATLRSLSVQRELVLVQRVLAQAGIQHMALKGAYLAWRAYPHPSLRPLRDIDILVHRQDALEAYEILLRGGLKRIQKYGYRGDPQTVMAVSKHLPPLQSASGQLTVELHTRVFHVPEGFNDHKDLSDTTRFWDQANEAQMAGENLMFESPVDLLLHLIVHAVYDHEFDNGPLFLSDLAFLLRTHRIDWSLFWALAEDLGYAAGCSLALGLAEYYWGNLSVQWNGHASSNSELAAPLEDVAPLLLRDLNERADVELQVQMSGQYYWLARIRYVFSRVFVSKKRMASLFTVKENDWYIFFYYPVRWFIVIARNARKLFRFKSHDDINLDAELLQKLRSGLARTAPN